MLLNILTDSVDSTGSSVIHPVNRAESLCFVRNEHFVRKSVVCFTSRLIIYQILVL